MFARAKLDNHFLVKRNHGKILMISINNECYKFDTTHFLLWNSALVLLETLLLVNFKNCAGLLLNRRVFGRELGLHCEPV